MTVPLDAGERWHGESGPGKAGDPALLTDGKAPLLSAPPSCLFALAAVAEW